MQNKKKYQSKSVVYESKKPKGQLTKTFQQSIRNPQNQKKLIQRSLTKSYLATISNNSIVDFNEDILKLKNNVFEKQMSVIEQQQSEYDINDQFQCNIDIRKSEQENNCFSCCGYFTPPYQKYNCKLSNFKSNQLFIKNIKTEKTQFYFNFNVLLAKIDLIDKQNQQGFRMGQTFYLDFLFARNQQFYQFKKILEKKIRMSDSIKYSINSIVSIPGFELNKYKLERQFIRECKTGDIILFRNPHTMAKLQRFFTNSKFDHVGVVIRDPVYDILLYESNGNTGVCLTPWKSVITYRWFVWRKLEGIDRSEQFIEKFHEFVMANLNTKYHLSFDKFFLKVSYIAQTQQQKGYFCSQLVARVYKQLKLLPTNVQQNNYKPACNYYPVDFSQKQQLQLKNGYLSPQYQIVFDEKVLAADYQ